jgi:HD-GYP domain-containing protein (c-di-GMP phosphodiesterase class II)
MAEFEVQLMEVAGNVHDLGKLAVPNAILEKPAKLSEDEFQVMKKHTYFTYTILNTIGGLRQLPEWAAFHHERLDGKGYPFHLAGDTLDTGARILAVADVFTALAEDRPYRGRLDDDKIVGIVTQMSADNKLDPQIVQVLTDNMERIRAEVTEWQAHMLDFYETQYVPLTYSTEAGRRADPGSR